MSAEVRNIVNYALLAIGAFLVGSAASLVPQLMDPSMPPLNWRIVLGTGLTALITAYGGSLMPRAGSTGIAAQVNALKAQGVPRSEMVVLSQDEAAPALAGGMTPTQVQQVADELELRMRATPAAPDSDPGLLSKPPRFLDDAEHPASRDVVTGTPPLPPPPGGRG